MGSVLQTIHFLIQVIKSNIVPFTKKIKIVSCNKVRNSFGPLCWPFVFASYLNVCCSEPKQNATANIFDPSRSTILLPLSCASLKSDCGMRLFADLMNYALASGDLLFPLFQLLFLFFHRKTKSHQPAIPPPIVGSP